MIAINTTTKPMENKKQTAVDWVLEYLWKNHHLSFSDSNLMKAKAMEKEQIIIAFEDGENNIDSDGFHLDIESAEHYYNETYGE